MDNDTPHTYPPTALQPLPPLPPSVSAHVNSDKSVIPFASFVIPIPEKEPSHSKKHDTGKSCRQGDSRTSRAAGRCPPSLSFISLQPPVGLSRVWARPAYPTCIQESVCAAIFLQSRRSRERGQDQRQILQAEWSSRDTGQRRLCFELHQKPAWPTGCERGFCPSTLLLWDSHLGSPLETLTSIHLWSPQDRKDINWIQRRTTKLIRGIEYPFCKERLRKLGLLSLKSEDFGVI